MGALMRAHDWSASPLGAPETWPQSLRSAVQICLSTPIVGAVHWGPELRILYNDAYGPVHRSRPQRTMRAHSVKIALFTAGERAPTARARRVVVIKRVEEETFARLAALDDDAGIGAAEMVGVARPVVEPVRAERDIAEIE